MAYRITLTCLALLMLSLVYEPVGAGLSGKHQKSEKDQSKDIVYVCACMKNKSCSCMTEAKTEGPGACGTQGGPPLKPVAADSDWAKENREALAKFFLALLIHGLPSCFRFFHQVGRADQLLRGHRSQ